MLKFTYLLLIVIFLGSESWAGNYLYGIIGDAGKWNENTQAVRDSIISEKVSKLILPGDNLYDLSSDYEHAWGPWHQKSLTFDIVALGNHTKGYKEEIQYFGMSGEFFSKTEAGQIRFLVLNSDNESTVDQQASWLNTELNEATEPFIFVIYHHPSYSIGQHNWKEKANFQRKIRPLLWKYRPKITALLVGHDHVATFTNFNELPVILSGATHEIFEMKPRKDVQDGIKVKTKWIYNGKDAHWAKLEINTDKKETWVHFIRGNDNKVMCSELILTGQKAQMQSNCAGH